VRFQGSPAVFPTNAAGFEKGIYAITTDGRLAQIWDTDRWWMDFPAEQAGFTDVRFQGSPAVFPTNAAGFEKGIYAITTDGKLAQIWDTDRWWMDFPAEKAYRIVEPEPTGSTSSGTTSGTGKTSGTTSAPKASYSYTCKQNPGGVEFTVKGVGLTQGTKVWIQPKFSGIFYAGGQVKKCGGDAQTQIPFGPFPVDGTGKFEATVPILYGCQPGCFVGIQVSTDREYWIDVVGPNCDCLAMMPVQCTGGQTNCDGACVDTQKDTNNCGECGIKCGPGKSCVAGVCKVVTSETCSEGTTNCNEACVNTRNDISNCGKCGIKCDPGKSCVDGVCTSYW
jgi:hypothetical protein